MRYYIALADNLKLQDSNVLYDSIEFEDLPILIDVPLLEPIIEQLISVCKKVALLEKRKEGNHQRLQDSDTGVKNTSSNILPVADEAYILAIKEFNNVDFDNLCRHIKGCLDKLVDDISSEKLFLSENNLNFTAIKQLIELRNFFNRVTENQNKKMYQKKYIYIMSN